MADALETEIKLLASPAMLEALRVHPKLRGRDTASALVTTYFDTPDRRLRLGGASLRVRTGGGGRVQTLKTAAGPSGISRSEWTAPASGETPLRSLFRGGARELLSRLLAGAALRPVAATRIARTTRRLRHRGSTIEIAFDEGEIEGGGRRQPVSELELELIKGRLADVVDLALALPLGPALRWSLVSKGERCDRLAFGIAATTASAEPLSANAATTVAAGFHAFAWSGLRQLLANKALALDSPDPEALRQCRVALRRLRVACSLFDELVGDDAAAALQAELKPVAACLGRACDLDRLAARLAAASNHLDLLTHLHARRDAAIASARLMLTGAPFQILLFRFVAWLEGGEWLERIAARGGTRPLEPFVALALADARRALRQARKSAATDAARYRLRPHVLTLLYAAHFFGPLLRGPLFPDRPGGGRRPDFTSGLGGLQESLDALDLSAALLALQEPEPADGAGLAARLAALLDAQPPERPLALWKMENVPAKASGPPADLVHSG